MLSLIWWKVCCSCCMSCRWLMFIHNCLSSLELPTSLCSQLYCWGYISLQKFQLCCFVIFSYWNFVLKFVFEGWWYLKGRNEWLFVYWYVIILWQIPKIQCTCLAFRPEFGKTQLLWKREILLAQAVLNEEWDSLEKILANNIDVWYGKCGKHTKYTQINDVWLSVKYLLRTSQRR